MENSFERNYEKEQEIRRQLDVANAQGNGEGKESAWAAYQDFRDGITAKGDIYASIYQLYSQARERGNESIDIDIDIDGRKAMELAYALRKHGVKRFTCSSCCSMAAEAAWQFIKRGWSLDGVAEINGRHMGLAVLDRRVIYGRDDF